MNAPVAPIGQPAGTFGRVAVVGDLGGHSHPLRRILERLGVVFDLPRRHRPTGPAWTEVDLCWPEDLHLVQVGDLVHRGPDSVGVVLFADRMIAAGRWTQVVGNHEQLYVADPAFSWPETLPEAAQRVLRRWWHDGLLRPAAAVTGPDGRGTLATHAGLTFGFWDAVGRPGTATEAAAALAGAAADGALWRPGLMLTGRPDLAAGPVWAEAGNEVYLSWLAAHRYGHAAPAAPGFDQVHGHSSAYWWDRRRWRCPDPVGALLTTDAGRRHVTARIGEATITGIDPDHGRVAASVHDPLLLAGTVTG